MFKTPEKINMYGAPIVRYNVYQDSTKEVYQHRIQPDNRIMLLQQNMDLGESLSAIGKDDGYLVDPNGNIRLPIVGDVYLQGLTRQEAARLLEKIFGVYYKDPVFQVEIMNMFVHVMGTAGTNTGGVSVPLDKENTHLLEILSRAGGVPTFSKIKFVKIIRGDVKNPQIIIVDMTQLRTIAEDDLIMQNGDTVYFEPKKIKLFADSVTPYMVFFTFINLLGTVLLLSRTFAGRN